MVKILIQANKNAHLAERILRPTISLRLLIHKKFEKYSE